MLAMLLTAVLLTGMAADALPAAAAASNIASGTDWVLDGNGVLTIKSDAGMTEWIKETFPSGMYRDQVTRAVIQPGVTSVAEYAFTNCTGMTGVTIPDTVTSIGGRAFSNCSNLTEVTIPDTVTSIGEHAFQFCHLTKITIPSGVETIGSQAFVVNDFTEITIPDGVSVIPSNMCSGCSKLTSVTLPASIQEIGAGAFGDWGGRTCEAMETVTLQGTTPPTLGDGVFEKCKFVEGGTQGISVPHGYADEYKEAWPDWAQYIQPDVHETELVPEKPANCTTEGSKEYYRCTGCDKWFTDEKGGNEITDKFSMVIPATGHIYEENVWKLDEIGHWHECSACGERMDARRHVYDDDSDMICDTCGYDRTSLDSQPPEGTITITTNNWNSFLHTITFGLFFRETQEITIQAEEKAGGVISGVDKVYYHLSESGMSETEVRALGADEWTEGNSVSVSPDRVCVVYAKSRIRQETQPIYLLTGWYLTVRHRRSAV